MLSYQDIKPRSRGRTKGADLTRTVIAARLAAALLAAVVAIPATTPRAASAAAEKSLTFPATGEQVRILRTPWGIPHVYASSTPGGSYGLGYAAGEDRLWPMDLLRRLVRGRLSELLGPVIVAEEQALVRTSYSGPELRAMYERLPEHVRAEMDGYVAGMNLYITEANSDPAKLPIEFVNYGAVPVQPLTVEDVMAVYQVLNFSAPGNVFAWGNFNLLRRLTSAYGAAEGTAKFDDLVRSVDPDAATTVPPDYDYRSVPTGAREGELVTLRRHVEDGRLSLAAQPAPAGHPGGPVRPVGVPDNAAADAALAAGEHNDALRLGRLSKIFGSNAQVVGPALSAQHNSLLTAGPQTDYSVPALYWEAAVHVPGKWEARGMTIAPLTYFAIGRGQGFTWTFTNGQQGDMADVYVERLDPSDPRAYEFRGQYEQMDCRTHSYTFHGVEFDTQEVCRTRHGPVISFDAANGIAYAERHAWWGREDLTVRSLRGMNMASSLEDFATGVLLMPTSYNILYADDEGNVAWWLTGLYPQRAPGADVRLPQDGTGSAEWRGVLPLRQQPHALNPQRGWIVNWNNYPAQGWRSARVPQAMNRVEKLQRAFARAPQPDPQGGTLPGDGRWDAHDLAANLRLGAYADDAWTLKPALPDPAALSSDVARQALALVQAWDGVAHDADADGQLDSPAVTIARRWQQVARTQLFGDDLPAADLPLVEDYGELRRTLVPGSKAPTHFDWLDGQDRATAAAVTFQAAVDELAASRGNDPATWLTGTPQTRYGHLNSHLLTDTVDSSVGECPETDRRCLEIVRNPAGGVVAPGYVPPHHAMARGVYNHVVAYQDVPGTRGAAAVSACGVLTPGNSALVNALGQQSPNFRDQRDLYATWQWRAHALSDAEVQEAAAGGTCVPAGGEG